MVVVMPALSVLVFAVRSVCILRVIKYTFAKIVRIVLVWNVVKILVSAVNARINVPV
jgi:hypothetical protein